MSRDRYRRLLLASTAMGRLWALYSLAPNVGFFAWNPLTEQLQL
jgi:hypothetical protein